MKKVKAPDKKHASRPSPSSHAGDHKWEILVGNDGHDYMSKPDSHGIYHWKKIVMGSTPEQYYSQFKSPPEKVYSFPKSELADLTKILQKGGVYLIKIGWDKVWDYLDYAWDDAVIYVRQKLQVSPTYDILANCSFIFYTELRRFWAQVNGKLYMQHNILPADKKFVMSAFREVFGKRYVWSGKANKAILVNV